MSPQHSLFKTITDPSNNPWPNPTPVYGYDDTVPLFGGDLFEAETNCVPAGNLGQIASSGFNNLSYFRRFRSAKEGEERGRRIEQTREEEAVVYEKDKTYIALVVGDGDNLELLKTRNLIWWTARRAKCASAVASAESLALLCFPLVWSFSPRAPDLAPGIHELFFEQAKATGKDFFVLPPSGDLYAYPAEMEGEAQDK